MKKKIAAVVGVLVVLATSFGLVRTSAAFRVRHSAYLMNPDYQGGGGCGVEVTDKGLTFTCK